MQNKTAIVTGGAQGIGKAIAFEFLKHDMRVAILDTDHEALEEIQAEATAAKNLLCLNCDISEESNIVCAVADTVDAFGRLDVLVNNAAYGQVPYGPFENMELDEWNHAIKVNLTGPLLMTKHCMPHLCLTKGCIVNIAAVLALQPEPHCEAAAASKSGLIGLTRALAASLAPQVRVNAVSPGWIEVGPWKKTSLRQYPPHSLAECNHHPVGRVGTPQDVAALVVFLASEQSSFITGQNFVVDGGVTRRALFPQ